MLCNNIGITFIQKYANTVTPIVLAVFTSFPIRIFTEKKVEKRFLWLHTLTQMATPNISIKKNGTKIPGMMNCLAKIKSSRSSCIPALERRLNQYPIQV